MIGILVLDFKSFLLGSFEWLEIARRKISCVSDKEQHKMKSPTEHMEERARKCGVSQESMEDELVW